MLPCPLNRIGVRFAAAVVPGAPDEPLGDEPPDGEPRRGALQMDAAGLQHRVALADDGHGSFVEVSKRRERGSAGHATLNEAAGIPSLLHGNLRDAAKGFAILVE